METSNKSLSPAEQTVLDEARKVNEERMQAIQDLAAIVAQRIDLEDRLKENTKQERRAVREAEKAGWTPAQIKRFMKPPRPQNTSQKKQTNEQLAQPEEQNEPQRQAGMTPDI